MAGLQSILLVVAGLQWFLPAVQLEPELTWVLEACDSSFLS